MYGTNSDYLPIKGCALALSLIGYYEYAHGHSIVACDDH
jgi:hypothetical protein